MFKEVSEQSRKDECLCRAYRCNNKKRTRDKFCSKHRHRRTKERDLVGYKYWILKSNATRRKKEFSITLAEFRQWCKETNYHNLTGRSGDSATIDRIDDSKGYSIDNIQILTLSENSRKLWGEDPVPF